MLFLRRLAALLKRLATLEPVLLRAVIGGIVLLAAVWGADLAGVGDQLGRSVDIIWPIGVLLVGWWTRTAVTPASAVVQVVTPDGTIVAGPASPLPDGTPLGETPRHAA